MLVAVAWLPAACDGEFDHPSPDGADLVDDATC